MNKLIKRRVPTYLTGFLFGLVAVLLILQVKKAVAPHFADQTLQPNPIELGVGGSLRLQLGDEPGKFLAWGFPTRLAVGLRAENGRVEPVISKEYKQLVDKETIVGPFTTAGEYDLVAHFYTCAFPGEKYCARVVLNQMIRAVSVGNAPASVDLVVNVKVAAEQASAAGKLLPQ
jgi:hypothetical protein